MKPSLKDFENKLTSMWNESNCVIVWAFFGIAFPWDGMKAEKWKWMLTSAEKTQSACKVLDNVFHIFINISQPTEYPWNDWHLEVVFLDHLSCPWAPFHEFVDFVLGIQAHSLVTLILYRVWSGAFSHLPFFSLPSQDLYPSLNCIAPPNLFLSKVHFSLLLILLSVCFCSWWSHSRGFSFEIRGERTREGLPVLWSLSGFYFLKIRFLFHKDQLH